MLGSPSVVTGRGLATRVWDPERGGGLGVIDEKI